MRTGFLIVLSMLIVFTLPARAGDGIHTFDGTPRQNLMNLFGEAMAMDEMCRYATINRNVLKRRAAKYEIQLRSGTSDYAFIQAKKTGFKSSLRRWDRDDFVCIMADAYYGDDGTTIPKMLIINKKFYKD